MGRPSLAEQRRIEICRALQSCMVQKGSYEITSVKDIAQQAGMAAGMIHHYFVNKDEMLYTTADMVLLAVQNVLDELLHTKDAAGRVQKLHELLEDQEQNRFLLMIYSLSLSMPPIKELILAKRQELEEALSSRLRRRSSFAGDAEARAEELMFLLESAIAQSALSEQNAAIRLLTVALEETFPANS